MFNSMIRILMIMVVSASMAMLQTSVMLGRSPSINDATIRVLVGMNVVYWLTLAPIMARSDLFRIVGFGVLSPMVGAIITGPPLDLMAVIRTGYLTLPIGVATAMLIKICMGYSRD